MFKLNIHRALLPAMGDRRQCGEPSGEKVAGRQNCAAHCVRAIWSPLSRANLSERKYESGAGEGLGVRVKLVAVLHVPSLRPSPPIPLFMNSTRWRGRGRYQNGAELYWADRPDEGRSRRVILPLTPGPSPAMTRCPSSRPSVRERGEVVHHRPRAGQYR